MSKAIQLPNPPPATHLAEPIGRRSTRGVKGLDHGGVGHVRAPTEVHEVAIPVHSGAAPVGYSRLDVFPSKYNIDMYFSTHVSIDD